MAFLYQLLGSKVWPPRDTKPDFSGRTILITGANSGLGYESVIKCVQGNAQRIIIGVRSIEKGEKAKQEILASTQGKDVVIDVVQVDMLDYDTIQAFATRVNREVGRLDYVILNAGISPMDFEQSTYGYQTGLQVNLISTTLLALLLLPKLMASKTKSFTPVLELVGSGTHQRMPSLLPDTDDPEKDPLQVYNSEESFKAFGLLQQYSLTKLFLMYVQWHLVKLVNDHTGTPRAWVIVVGPGPTQSGLGRDLQDKSFAIRTAAGIINLMMKISEQGARTYISGLMLGEKGHGEFWQWDSINSPAKWCSDENAVTRSERVWASVINALKKDVPDIGKLVEKIKDEVPSSKL